MEILTSSKLGTLLLVAFLWIFPGQSLDMEIPKKNIEVINGQSVVLQAWYNPATDIKNSTVIWNFIAVNSQQVIIYSLGQQSKGSQFSDRVHFMNPMPNRNLSISINNTQESDSGRYVCQVIIPGQLGYTGEMILDVKVPPSKPLCLMMGKPMLKNNVTLSCNSNLGKPTPQYKWSKSSPGTEVFFSPMLDEKLGTLKLGNLSSSMSGKYICMATNTAGVESCEILLEVSTSTNAGVIAGTTVGSVLALLAIMVFLVFLLRKKRDPEEDMANDIKEDAQAPKRISWEKSGSGSDIVSKNGTLSSIATGPHLRDRDHNHYHHHKQPPASDNASIITATGSTAGYRPRPSEHGLPGHGARAGPLRGAPSPNGGSLQRTERAQPQAPPPLPTSMTASNISRMGGVPIMVPAQNQAGSLV